VVGYELPDGSELASPATQLCELSTARAAA
jgi:hypothetical protein